MIGEISPLGRGLRTGLDTDPAYHSIVPPLYPSTNYSFAEPGKSSGYEYSWTANPTRDQLGAAIATLEAGAHGMMIEILNEIVGQRADAKKFHLIVVLWK